MSLAGAYMLPWTVLKSRRGDVSLILLLRLLV